MAFKKISALYFMADSTEDLINLPDAQMGATCFVITEACEYKSTSDGEWIKQVNSASNGNGNTADLTGYATQSYVNEKIGNLVSSAPENLDTLAELATAFKDNKNVLEVLNEAIGNKAEKTDIPDVSNLQPKGDYALKSELPSTSGFATEEFVANKIAEAELNNKDVDLSGYYTKSEVDNKIADIEHPVTDLSGYVTNEELLEAVGNINIPSIEGLASEEYVDEAIAGIDHPTIDLSDYALKEEIPSIEGLASEGYVNNAVDNIVHPSVDLSGFATKSYVQRAIDGISINDAAHSFMIPNPVDKSYYAGKKIACIGDSVTAGVGANGNPYVTQLGATLGATMVNLGASGTVLCTGGHRGCNIGKLSESSLGGADIVTILMGINDWDQAKADYYDLGDINSTDTSTIYGAVKMWCDRIVELKNTASLAHTKFYFMTPLQTSWNHSKGSNSWDQNKVNIHGFKLRDLCQAIIDVCALYKIPVIDLNLYSGIYYNSADDQTTNSLGGDGIHPNEAGHTEITKAIIRGLEQNAGYESITDTLYYLLAFAAKEMGTELSYPVSAKYAIAEKDIPITGITLSNTTIILTAGETYTLVPTLVPENTTQTNIVWETSNANIASVREGVVTAIAEGTVTIICKSADNAEISAAATVVVNAAASNDLTALMLSDEAVTVNAGESHTMSVAFVPAATAQTDVTWSCDDENVAEIEPSSDGKTCVITAKNVGQCYIKVTSNVNNAISDSCLFTTTEVAEEPEPDEPIPAALFNLGPGATYNEETGLLTSGLFTSGNTNTAVYNQPLKPGMEIEVEYGCTNNQFTAFGVDTASKPEDVILAQDKYATGLFNFYYDMPTQHDAINSLTSGTTTKNTMISTGNKANPKVAILKRDADGVFSGSVNGVDCVIPANAYVTTAQDTEDLYVFFGGTNGGTTTYWKVNYFGALRNEPVTPEEPENPDMPVEPTDVPWVLGAKTRYNAKEDYIYGTGMFNTGTDYVAIYNVPLTANMEVEIEGSREAADNAQYTVCGLTDSLAVADTHCGNNRYAEGVYNVYYDAPSKNAVISYLRDGPQRLSTTGNKDNPRICTFKRDADGVITAYHAGTLLNIPAVEAANNAENLYVMIAGPGAASQWKIKYIGELR